MPLTTIILDMFSFYYYQQQPPFWLFCFCLLNWGWEYGGWLYIKDFLSDTTNYYKIRFDYQSSAESSLAWLLPGEKPFLGLLEIGASLGQPARPERPIVDAESIQTKSGFWTELQRETHLVVIASQAWTNLEIYSQKYKSCNCSKFLPQWCWERGAVCTTWGCSCGVCQKRTDFPQRICWMWSKVESHWRGTQPAPSRTWSFSGGHSVGTSLVQPSWWESWRWSSPGALSPPFASQHGFEATPTAPSFPSSAFPHSPSKRRKEVLTRFPTTRGLPFAPTCSHKVRALCKASKRHAESGWSGGVLFANFSTNSGYSVTYMHGNVWYFSIVADTVDIVHCLTLFHYPFNRFEKVEWQRHALHPLVSLALA